ncbi:MAG: GDSL-type esterase/lipase family protein [Blautia sp.]|nr:GDSL-type esterase/lipase family protein [Blautia sp.]
MNRKNNKRSAFRISFVVIPAAVIAGAGIIAFCVWRPSSHQDIACQENVARLEQLETSDISSIEKQLQELKQQNNEEALSAMQEDISSGSGSVLSNVEIRQKFQGTVIIGDSITESIMEYGFLDTDVVISKRGLSIADADEQLDTAISLYPSCVFLAFGSNDLELYDGNVEPFKEAYKTQVSKLQSSLPDVPVYINGILPLQDVAIAQNDALSHYPEFNAALEELCTELGCTFIDNSFIVENNPSMYEPDGEHVIMDFYPLWLTYMAEMAGL